MNSDPRLHDSLRRLESTVVDESSELSHIASQESLPASRRSSSGVTIFVPNWNHETDLPRSLKSAFEAVHALESEGFEAEILVIDDASRDGSVKLIRTLQALYDLQCLRLIRLQKNHGQVRLTNLALQIAKFRYVLRLDSDNQLVPENIPTFLGSSIETGATILYGNLIRLRSGRIDEKMQLVSNMPATFRLIEQNYFDALCIMDAPDILELGGFTRVNPYSPEDWEMILHLIANECLLVFVPLLMGYYHMSPQSASTELGVTDSGRNTIRRIYGSREWDKKRAGRIYYPGAGYLDEWAY